MNDASPKAYEAFVEADKAKRELILNLTGMTLATVVAVVLLACLTSYCSQPNRGTPIDREAQAARIIENNKMVSCMKARGSWMPVKVTYANGGSESIMTCVTDSALPLVQQLNRKEG